MLTSMHEVMISFGHSWFAEFFILNKNAINSAIEIRVKDLSTIAESKKDLYTIATAKRFIYHC